jgi:Subtilase family
MAFLKWGASRGRGRLFGLAVLVIAAAVVIPTTSLGSTTKTSGSKGDGSDPILVAASAQAGVPADQLTVADEFTQTLPVTGQTLDVAKVVNPSTGDAYQVAVDQRGQAVDFAAAQASESAASEARFGKLDPRLAALLDTLTGNQKIPVTIWVDVPNVVADRPAGQSLADHLAAVEASVAPARQAVVDGIRQLGGRATTPQYAPTVSAELNKGQIMSLARRSDVDTIYGPEKYRLFQDDSATTERANSIWATGNLGFGTSSRPAVHEPDGVSDTNPFLSNASHPVLFYCSSVMAGCPNGKALSTFGGHASRVAGAIASTHPLFRGIAPGAQMILSENSQTFNDVDLQRANEWGRGNGADPTNMSWGTVCGGFQTNMSRYVDWATKVLAQTFVISAGNNSCGNNDHKVSAPGLAWSAITVGATGDNNNGFWTGDFLTSFSNFVNPGFAPGMEKPEVVAVGFDQCLTNHLATFIDCGNAGTSFSAPQVAGQVTDMLARRPGQNMWPETNKAAVLVSAYHDITAGTSQDGLGEVVMNNSDDTYRLGRFFNNSMPSGTPADINHLVSLVAGQRVKVAIAWDSIASCGAGPLRTCPSDTLTGEDIDLHILRPDGTFLIGSLSVQNAWESVEFTAPVTGTYTFREHRFSNPLAASTFIGMAWSIRSIPDICSPPARTFGPSGGSLFTSTANGPTYFDSYAGWGFSQTGREQLFTYVNTAPHNLTFTDTNGNIDLHALQFACSPFSIVPTVRANGFNSITLVNAAPGTYRFIGDGFNGFVGTDTFTLTVAAPTSTTSSVTSDSATPPPGR